MRAEIEWNEKLLIDLEWPYFPAADLMRMMFSSYATNTKILRVSYTTCPLIRFRFIFM